MNAFEIVEGIVLDFSSLQSVELFSFFDRRVKHLIVGSCAIFFLLNKIQSSVAFHLKICMRDRDRHVVKVIVLCADNCAVLIILTNESGGQNKLSVKPRGSSLFNFFFTANRGNG